MAGANPTGRQQIDTLCTQGFECPQNLLTDDELSRLSVEKPARWCAQLKEQLDWIFITCKQTKTTANCCSRGIV